jgi:hypothetical protein
MVRHRALRQRQAGRQRQQDGDEGEHSASPHEGMLPATILSATTFRFERALQASKFRDSPLRVWSAQYVVASSAVKWVFVVLAEFATIRVTVL